MRDSLAPKPNDDNTVDVRVAGKARQHLLRHRRIRRHVRAARVEHDADRAAHLTCNDARGLAAARAGGQDEHMVADARTTILAFISPELHRSHPFFPIYSEA